MENSKVRVRLYKEEAEHLGITPRKNDNRRANTQYIITEEQKMLKDSAAELLKAKAPVNEMRALRDQGYMTFDSNLWREIASLGWTALTIPERYNGLDFGHVGLGQILEETGRNLSKSPSNVMANVPTHC